MADHRLDEGAAPSANGFQIIQELETLSCKEENVAQHSLPVEALTFEPSPSLIVSPFDNGDSERKIHCNIELQANEQEKLQAMQREAAAQGLKFFPSITAMATRFLSHARMDVKKALRCMQATQEWRQGYFADGPIVDKSVQEDLQHGIVYFSGRDSDLRPTLIVRGARIPQQWYKEKRVDKLIRLLVFCMEYMVRYMLVPGRVENLNVIVDLKGLGLSQVSVSALSDVYKVMSYHYSGRVFKFFIAHIPSSLSMIAGMVKSLLTDRQKQKLCMLKDVKELRKYFALHQLEEDLGGSRPAFSTFYPFPLQPGPFEGGYAGGPDCAAVPSLHEALTADAVVGRLWDPSKTREENLFIDLRPEAECFLEKCGISLAPSPNTTSSTQPCFEDQDDEPSRRESYASVRSRTTQNEVKEHQDVAQQSVAEASTEEGSSEGRCEAHDKDAWDLPDASPRSPWIDETEVRNTSSGTFGNAFGCLRCHPAKVALRPQQQLPVTTTTTKSTTMTEVTVTTQPGALTGTAVTMATTNMTAVPDIECGRLLSL